MWPLLWRKVLRNFVSRGGWGLWLPLGVGFRIPIHWPGLGSGNRAVRCRVSELVDGEKLGLVVREGLVLLREVESVIVVTLGETPEVIRDLGSHGVLAVVKLRPLQGEGVHRLRGPGPLIAQPRLPAHRTRGRRSAVTRRFARMRCWTVTHSGSSSCTL